MSVSLCLTGTDSPYLLNFMSIITLCFQKHETSLCRLCWAHNSRCFSLSVPPSFFFLFLCLVNLWPSCICYLFLESGFRLWAHSFLLKWTLLQILVDEAPYLSPCVFLPLTHSKPQIRSVRTLCRSESSHGSFITKYSLVIKVNGAAKVRDLEYGALPAWMSCRRQMSLISHCTLH